MAVWYASEVKEIYLKNYFYKSQNTTAFLRNFFNRKLEKNSEKINFMPESPKCHIFGFIYYIIFILTISMSGLMFCTANP